MNKFDTRSLLNPGQKINSVIRFLAIPISVLFLVAGADHVHTLVFESRTIGSVLTNVINIFLTGFVLWPFSYVAIKGKSPNYWHPYK